MKLYLGSDFSVPEDAVTQTFAIFGKRGSGKSNAGTVLAEAMFKAHLPFVVLDPVDAWWGLKASFDGKGPGLAVYVFGGPHGDLPLEPTAGAMMADVLVEHRISAVLSFKGWSGGQRTRFASDFAERLLQRNSEPLHVFLEEADAFIPQRPFKGEEVMLGNFDRLVRWGRQSGLGCTLITQRSAKVNKDVTTQAETLIAFRVIGPQDRDAIDNWIKFHAGEEKRQEVLSSIATLKDGQAWVWSPEWLEILRRVTFRRRETYDSAATPKPGEKRPAPKQLAPVDLERLRTKMRGTIEKAEATSVPKLQARIQELERLLRTKKNETLVEQHVREVQVRVEVPVLRDGQLARLEKMLERGAGIAKAIQSGLAEMAPLVAKVAQPTKIPLHQPGLMPAVSRRPSVVALPAQRAAQGKEQRQGPGTLDSSVRIGQGERKVLAALAQWPDGRTPRDLAFLAGYSAKASTIGVILSKLRQAGLVEPAEKGQPVRATEAGIAEAGGAEELPSGRALLAHWMGHPRIGEGERKVLRALIDAYPDALTHEELCERTNYSPIASTMGVILSKLRKLGLVEAGARRIPASLYEAISEEVA